MSDTTLTTFKSNLSVDQYAALMHIQDFLDSDDEIFILKGYAGTGKTYLINILCNILGKMKRPFDLLAPTGRAARILSAKTQRGAATVHSRIFMREGKLFGEDENDDGFVFTFKLRPNEDSPDTLYIVDEASMISDGVQKNEQLVFGSGSVLKDLFRYAGITHREESEAAYKKYVAKLMEAGEEEINRGPLRRKILFVGDPAQLPPVETSFSAAMDRKYLADNFNLRTRSFMLKEIFRQEAESVILKNATAIRTGIQANSFTSFRLAEGSGFIVVSPQDDALSELLTGLARDDEAMIITFTNENAGRYNMLLRKQLFEEKWTDIQQGDKLLIAANNYFYNLLNGDIVTVLNVLDAPEVFRVVVPKFNKEFEIVFRTLEIEIPLADGEGAQIEVKVIQSLLTSNNRSLPYEEIIALRSIARQTSGVPFPDKKLKKTRPDEYNKLRDEYIAAMMSNPYLNALQVKYGYAVTCHKAQGGEWNSVFVDFSGFRFNQNDQFYRWAYTAITRGKEKIYAFKLPFFGSAALPVPPKEEEGLQKDVTPSKVFVLKKINDAPALKTIPSFTPLTLKHGKRAKKPQDPMARLKSKVKKELKAGNYSYLGDTETDTVLNVKFGNEKGSFEIEFVVDNETGTCKFELLSGVLPLSLQRRFAKFKP